MSRYLIRRVIGAVLVAIVLGLLSQTGALAEEPEPETWTPVALSDDDRQLFGVGFAVTSMLLAAVLVAQLGRR